ncbi:MAG: hypothetical protein HQ574_06695 [Chloroflexi bacterium]|nr:hypothetical protein [Chloroflexota bacterium]
MTKKTFNSLILITLLALILGGCALPVGRTSVPTEAPPTQDLNALAAITQQAAEHVAQETLSAPTATLSPTATLTPLPPETASPTLELLPLSSTEIKFQAGGTIAYLKGEIKAGQQISFTLGAGGGQTLIATVSSEANQVYFEIKDLEDGEVLVPFSDEASSVQTKLPWTGDFQITLISPVDLDYFLSVEVPANLVVSPGMGSAIVDGYIDVLGTFHPEVFTRVRYLMQLQAGSILDVNVNSPAIDDLSLALIGAEDHQPYLRHEVQSGSIEGFIVTESQGYYLDVYSVSGESAAFSLIIKIE